MNALLKEIRHNPLLWLLVFVPAVFAAAKLQARGAHAAVSCFRSWPSCRWRRCSVTPPNRWRPRPAMRSAGCSTPRWAT